MAIKDGDKRPQTSNNPIVVVAPTGPDGKVSAASPLEKYAFHGATPVVQRSGSAQAAVSASTEATLSDSAGATYTATEQTAINNLVARVNSLKTVVDQQKTLINELRAALVEKGLIKGS